jgi:hypothetical protein
VWPLGFLALLFKSAALANRTNVTIDDNFGDPKTGLQLAYLPVGAWDYGPSCPNCTVHPDANNTYLGMASHLTFYLTLISIAVGTWHVGMFVGGL